jgi:hypothetical protein
MTSRKRKEHKREEAKSTHLHTMLFNVMFELHNILSTDICIVQGSSYLSANLGHWQSPREKLEKQIWFPDLSLQSLLELIIKQVVGIVENLKHRLYIRC